MTLTAIVTNHGYAHWLPRCLESALPFCDEVLVYDDGSTDDSLAVLARYPVTVVHREKATGDPVWGSNLGIEAASGTHLIFLDADNYLLGAPPVTDADYTFAAIKIVNADESPHALWEYPGWPLTAHACWDKFVANPRSMPFPWGGVWRTAFVKPLRWRRWDTTSFACDFRTALDWCKHDPTLAYSPEPFLAFRKHGGQWSASPEREVAFAEAKQVAAVESW